MKRLMRNRIRIFLTIIFAAVLLPWYVYSQSLPAPSGLIVEFLRAPHEAVVTNPKPKLGWVFPQAGIEQAAYRVLVASSPFLLKENTADLWDSGVIKDVNSVNVPYAGKSLNDNSVYWWQVKVWSAAGLESTYSNPQQFITGQFDRSDVDYPGESRWVEISTGQWVSEDKQRADFHRYKPKAIVTKTSGCYFVDFGKSVIGILEFTATATSDGTPIIVHMGERKNEDETVNKDPGRSNIGYDKVEMKLRKGTHHYVVKIKETAPKGYLHSQKLAPHYPEVLPFRYVEVNGDASFFRIDEFQQAALYYYFDDEASSFTSSDKNLNKVWDLCKFTLKATPFLGVYADGNRERMPYEADAYIQQLGHYAVDREYAISKYTINFLLDHASWPTEWHMHMVMMAWDYYMHTGDDNLLKERYEDLKRKSLIGLTEKNGLISTRTGKKTLEFVRSLNYPGRLEAFRDIVDWPHGAQAGKQASNQSPVAGGETDGYVFTDYNTVVNAFHYRSLVLMEKIARVVGNSKDQAFFAKRANEHRKAFMSVFFDRKKGIFRDGEATDHSSLHANMFPLAFGVVPRENIRTVAEFVKSRGMACSVYGSQYLLDALYNAGEADHALGLMTSDSKRSWLNMIRVGSSMTTEAWDEFFKPNLTWNHAWGAAPANVVARKLMGIEPVEPSFRKFTVAPQPGKLENAAVRVPTIRGPIECELVNQGNKWLMSISVPGNAEAEILVPTVFSRVLINGQEAKPVGRREYAGNDRNVFLVKAGLHSVVSER
jgi:alpha-L-rhamnosidase